MLTPMEYYTSHYAPKEENQNSGHLILKYRWIVDFIESCLNDPHCDDEGKKAALGLLKFCTHPEAGKLLKKLVSGTFCSDNIRQYASLLMLDRGDVKSGDTLELTLKGQKHKTKLQTIELDPEYEFCPIPEDAEAEFRDLLRLSESGDPDWKTIAESYHKLYLRHPSCFLFEFYYASALVYDNTLLDVAEKIVRRIAQEHPEYLIAHSLLLNILSQQERYEEGIQLIKNMKLPDKTHPNAYIHLLEIEILFFIHQQKLDEAKSILQVLKQLADENPLIKDFEELYESLTLLVKAERMMASKAKKMNRRHPRKKR